MSTERNPMAETTPAPETVQTIVAQRIGVLQNGYIANRSAGVAALARLRRAVGKPPGSVLDVLEHTLAPEFARNWSADTPSWDETAAHLCMTLYAVHQQSQSHRMHQPGRRLGTAVRRLIHEAEVKPDHPVTRRFTMLGTADSLDELVHHLRGMVQLLRAEQIPLDYGLLARQLVHWQRPNGPAAVRLVWGRDFHFAKQTETP
ncbi:type I-E CRISPR-associated protein Cse2/CasB [Actinokineospora sp.]|uniref:type I-E CRISPR-associated protein Cse2/CasB n=1 Tax=Actinokineospora sp. TaxID=1872133 RepID=UPI00403822CB